MMNARAIAGSLLALHALPGRAAEPVPVPVAQLPAAPVVDGNLADWGKAGWLKIPVKPAVDREERARWGLEGEDRNVTGERVVELKAGVFADRFYLAVRWPDDTADAEHKGWEWTGAKYAEGKRREDMFAVRFHKEGDFDRSMLAGRSYSVDVWLWSAARTNPAGLAEDWWHQLSGRPIDDAAEYMIPGVGTIYIKKHRDAGSPIYRHARAPKEKGAERLPSIELTGNAAGSVADVAARGRWNGGHWQLEFSRRLDTGNGDDVAFVAGRKILGQIAVFNRGFDEHKSISEPLRFDFTALPR